MHVNIGWMELPLLSHFYLQTEDIYIFTVGFLQFHHLISHERRASIFFTFITSSNPQRTNGGHKCCSQCLLLRLTGLCHCCGRAQWQLRQCHCSFQELEKAAMDHQLPAWSWLFWRRRLPEALFFNRCKKPLFSSIHSIRECNQILSAVSNRGTIKHKNIIKILSFFYLISAIHSLSSASWRRLKALVCFPVKLQIQTTLYIMITVLFLLSKTVLSGT